MLLLMEITIFYVNECIQLQIDMVVRTQDRVRQSAVVLYCVGTTFNIESLAKVARVKKREID